MQITVQKIYLIAVEISENVFRLFLLIVRYVFSIAEVVIDGAANAGLYTYRKARNFLKSLFGFNIYKIDNRLSLVYVVKSNLISIYKSDRIIYSNLLAPPSLI